MDAHQPTNKSKTSSSQRTKKALLGPGCDEKRRTALLRALIEMGGTVVDHQWSVVGSIDHETLRVRIDKAELLVES